MARTVLTIMAIQGGPDVVDLSEAVVPPAGGIAAHPLAIGAEDPDLRSFREDVEGAGRTASVGKALWQALAGQPAVANELAAAVAQKAPIYVDDRSELAQSLPWEALCDGSGTFLALTDGLQLGRIVGSLQSEAPRRKLDPPLRVLAVLAAAGGAAGETAEKELQALDKALSAKGLDFRLRVIGCDDAVKAAIAAKNDPRFTFEPLVSAETIVEAVETFRPHILHLFCHGFHQPAPRLELATRSDQELGEGRGSVVLELPDFRRMLQRWADVWLVVLNCCLGAAPGEQLQPLARQMVLEGYPAAVGMSEPIDRRDAHLFAEAFHASLLRYLTKAVKKPPPVPLDWPALLVEPRQKLARQHQPALSAAGLTKPWTLPVLYVTRQPFELTKVLAPPDPVRAAEIQSELDLLETARADLVTRPGLEAVLAQVDQRIETLRKELAGD